MKHLTLVQKFTSSFETLSAWGGSLFVVKNKPVHILSELGKVPTFLSVFQNIFTIVFSFKIGAFAKCCEMEINVFVICAVLIKNQISCNLHNFANKKLVRKILVSYKIQCQAVLVPNL